MKLHTLSVARVVDGGRNCSIEVVGDGVVLIAAGVEQCFVVGLQALS